MRCRFSLAWGGDVEVLNLSQSLLPKILGVYMADEKLFKIV